eukprot:GHVU01169061.1.p1 GENE.GHVU01169061.1~~GHVU01169061.1.p1  ORF type:complete len:155 (-),score=2.97 GHVU01169061.1:91-555(-)
MADEMRDDMCECVDDCMRAWTSDCVCRLICALRLLAYGGSFVLKIFTLFEPSSFSILTLMKNYFEKVMGLVSSSPPVHRCILHACVCPSRRSCQSVSRSGGAVSHGDILSSLHPTAGSCSSSSQLLSIYCFIDDAAINQFVSYLFASYPRRCSY